MSARFPTLCCVAFAVAVVCCVAFAVAVVVVVAAVVEEEGGEEEEGDGMLPQQKQKPHNTMWGKINIPSLLVCLGEVSIFLDTSLQLLDGSLDHLIVQFF